MRPITRTVLIHMAQCCATARARLRVLLFTRRSPAAACLMVATLSSVLIRSTATIRMTVSYSTEQALNAVYSVALRCGRIRQRRKWTRLQRRCTESAILVPCLRGRTSNRATTTRHWMTTVLFVKARVFTTSRCWWACI